jgi:hypothetical protein
MAATTPQGEGCQKRSWFSGKELQHQGEIDGCDLIGTDVETRTGWANTSIDV